MANTNQSDYSERVKCSSCNGGATSPNGPGGEWGCTDCMGKGLDPMAFAGGIEQALNDAYAEGRKDEAEALAHRGYVLFGAGAYLLTICEGDERGPELVAHLATEEEKQGRTVGDLGDVVPGKEIPLERVAVRLQFASERGLFSLEQQLRMLREQYFPAPQES